MTSAAAALSRSREATPAQTRVPAFDWQAVTSDLDAGGCAILPKLLSPEECASIAALYADERPFRSHVIMARHGFGKGEYRYFRYPLPVLIDDLRTALYARLAPVANEWNARMWLAERYPADHASFLRECHDAGQTPPRRCCCNTAGATTIACIRICMARWRFRFRSRFFCRSPALISPAANSC